MTPDTTFLKLIDSNHLYLDLSTDTLDRIWEQTPSFSSVTSRWQAYRNQACLTAFMAWLEEEQGFRAKVWPSRATLPSFWEVVNGVAINFDGSRLVLITTDAIDLSELRVPQEWVDIPTWAADYYLAVQFNPDDGYIRVFGYITHQQLKEKGSYDASDRTYCLDEQDLISDLAVLWVARQLCPEEILRQEIAPLPFLSLAQAENLLARLGNSSVLLPRLEIPFQLWGALLEHGAWRQRLYEKRQGINEQWSILKWLGDGISQTAQQLGWGLVDLQPHLSARGFEEQSSNVSLSRTLAIAGNNYELRVFPQINPEIIIIRFELRSSSNSLIPAGFKLRLLTEDLLPFENNEDIATTAVEILYIEVSVEPGEGLVWEIEPQPENYEREILRF